MVPALRDENTRTVAAYRHAKREIELSGRPTHLPEPIQEISLRGVHTHDVISAICDYYSPPLVDGDPRRVLEGSFAARRSEIREVAPGVAVGVYARLVPVGDVYGAVVADCNAPRLAQRVAAQEATAELAHKDPCNHVIIR